MTGRSSPIDTGAFVREEMTGASVWQRNTANPVDWLVALPDPCHEEMDVVVQAIRRERPPQITRLTPQQFSMPTCVETMRLVRDRLVSGPGVVIVDRVLVDRYTSEENRALAWLLASMMDPVVAQAWDGTVIYDVKDTGKQLGYGVRRSITNREQEFHTDGGFLRLPPELVGLFCIYPAAEGGISRVASLLTVHNQLRAAKPEVLARLYRPFYWDRQAEHAPEDAKVSWQPIFEHDGTTLTVRYYDDYIRHGYELAGQVLDSAGMAALAAMKELVEAPENFVELVLEQGQIQYINNRHLAHSRTKFHDRGDAKRHLLRLWNRSSGLREPYGL